MRNAVERTTPFALYCYTIFVLWYTLYRHAQADVVERRLRQPWCTAKTEPGFAGMTADLRHVIVAARVAPIRVAQPIDAENPGRPIRLPKQDWAWQPDPIRPAKTAKPS